MIYLSLTDLKAIVDKLETLNMPGVRIDNTISMVERATSDNGYTLFRLENIGSIYGKAIKGIVTTLNNNLNK